MSDLGKAYAEALARKDFDAVGALLHPQVDFRGMTPSRTWEASDRDDVVSRILQSWFEDSDHIEEVLSVETDAVADRERVGYRFRVSNPDGNYVVEQQAYLEERDGQIAWMRVVCSGFRPLA
jgi:ketosteroid isomerase-like protein